MGRPGPVPGPVELEVPGYRDRPALDQLLGWMLGEAGPWRSNTEGLSALCQPGWVPGVTGPMGLVSEVCPGVGRTDEEQGSGSPVLRGVPGWLVWGGRGPGTGLCKSGHVSGM